MPSLADSAVIFILALMLFGPKKLPQLARQLGKLMAEFRRASNEFRMQMDDEFRQIEQAEHRKKIEAMEAAAPKSPTMQELTEQSLDIPITPHVELDHEQLAAQQTPPAEPEEFQPQNISDASTTVEPAPAPLPIASNGDLHLMPPETGLPVGRSNSIGGFAEPIPATPETETTTHG